MPDAIIDEIGRSARRVEVQLAELEAADVPPAAFVETDLYRSGEQLKAWQRAFIALFLEHRRIYGTARLLLADEVGVGKTLSLAGSALVSSLLADGPILVLCPAALTSQWQIELKDQLNIPAAVWRSVEKAWQLDPDEMPLPSSGPTGILTCPRQIAIVSTGLIFHLTPEREYLLSRRFGMVILDEAHRARTSREFSSKTGRPNNLLSFMQMAALRSKHILLGTATPIQTDISDLWDLMSVLNTGAGHVLGDSWSHWADCDSAIPVITGDRTVIDEREAWDWFRNPIPPSTEVEVVFGHVRSALGMSDSEYISTIAYSDIPDEEGFIHEMFEDEILGEAGGLSFFQRNNPIVRHVVLRTRKQLEDKGLIPRIAVDIHPVKGQALPVIFDGLGLRTASSFDIAYKAAEDFTAAFGKRQQSASLLRGLILERLCSSYASGLSTARKLLEGRRPEAEDDETFDFQIEDLASEEEERRHLEIMIAALASRATDPKLEAVLYFLLERNWLDQGCIIFSRFFDTVRWIAQRLTERLPAESIAIYAGAGKSGIYFNEQWCTVERAQIKKSVAGRTIRLLVATDAACEGLNLQSLGTLINIDLPWNPSRLEQRIGRIKRIGQRRERIDVLNLVYHGTRDETIYDAISSRMRDRYNIFGSLPDVIEDEWIDNIERLEESLRDYTTKKREANAFTLRYSDDVDDDQRRWELCERVLARRDVIERLSRGW